MATLKVKIEESIILDNQNYNSKNTLEVESIESISKRIINCPANQDTTIAVFQTAVNTSDSAFDLEDTKYVRVTNLESTNSCNLSLQISAAEDGSPDESTTIALKAGYSFIIGSLHDGIDTSDANSTIITDLKDLESLIIDGGSNAIKIEIFIAGA